MYSCERFIILNGLGEIGEGEFGESGLNFLPEWLPLFFGPMVGRLSREFEDGGDLFCGEVLDGEVVVGEAGVGAFPAFVVLFDGAHFGVAEK